MKLHERVAVVTGGGRGIGRACALQLASEGARVVVADVDDEAGRTVVAEITGAAGAAGAAATGPLDGAPDGNGAEEAARAGPPASFIHTDVTKAEEVGTMVEETVRSFGTIHILVNNAGTDIKGAVEELSQETWDFLMALNLRGTFLCTRAVLPEMRAKRYGRIVNMSSMAGKTGEPYTSPYCASKFGVIGFTQSLALEVGADQVTINAVCPGAVETDLNKKSVSQSAKASGRSYDEELYEKFIKLTPLGRMATPSDVAYAVAFLASDEAAFITGSTLNVSGGREMH